VRVRGLAVALAAAALLLAGCAPAAPARPAVPTVHWTSAPASPLDADPAVKAARAADLAAAVASVLWDYSRADLRATETPELISDEYHGYRSRFLGHPDPVVARGPSIWLPMSVTPTAEGADVVVCDASRDWTVRKGHTPSYDLASGLRTTIHLTGTAGSYKADAITGSGFACDATGARVGSFVPKPEIPAISEEDVRAPKG
jgi:hypothetical protein